MSKSEETKQSNQAPVSGGLEREPNQFYIDLCLSPDSVETIRIRRKVFFPGNSRDGYFSYKGKRVKVLLWDNPLWAIL